MIREIYLSNFGPHKKLILKDLHPNLNVIIGNSGTGKTSIFRALRMLFNNEPSGAAKLYKPKDDKKLSIKVLIDDIVITREPKKYLIKSIDLEKPIELTSFGKGVPEPIKKILNLQDINWQLQIHEHFLILKNGGEAAKYLNPILGSNESELIISKVKEQTSKLKDELKLHNSIIKQNEKTLIVFQNIEDFLKRINKIQSHIEHLQANEKTNFSLTRKVNSLLEIEPQIINSLKIKSYLKKIGKIEEVNKNINKLENKINKISFILTKITNIKIISVTSFLKTFKKIETKLERQDHLQKQIEKLRSLLRSYTTNDEAIELGLLEYEEAKQEWNEKFSKLKICLLCGQEIKKGKGCAKDHSHY